NNHKGYRLATSVGGANTGEGGDVIVADDPHNVQDVESEVTRKSAVRWWNEVMSTRGNNPETARRIVIMQRVHEQDLAGDILEKGGYVHLNLPMEYEAKFSQASGHKSSPSTLWELRRPSRDGRLRRGVRHARADLMEEVEVFALARPRLANDEVGVVLSLEGHVPRPASVVGPTFEEP